MQLRDIHDDWEDSLGSSRCSSLERDLVASRSRAQLLEAKLASTFEANCVLHDQLDQVTHQVEVEQASVQRKIRALVECHELDLANIHSTYATQPAEHEECSAAIFRLQEEIELTTLGHNDEITAVKHTIKTLQDQLAAATSVRNTARQWVGELEEHNRTTVKDAVSDLPPF